MFWIRNIAIEGKMVIDSFFPDEVLRRERITDICFGKNLKIE
jgi:hypothetical protein